ncbi:iron complex outermembrane receptor protein [Mucilaginibacter frigoritolerans]|uniref:Iron complex outermembrane receptor protein n=1 Tax=Mucilaginibacter frigoritolerans TaxID=652788 RepID=A0A562TQ07_9SPHI|nr:TonB-dependent receptor [Mucilaginibacter frigoritolerans]TWI95328.1 iron complex outermembrane receptor protein [Mucilaginibacter frigoritolerans]
MYFKLTYPPSQTRIHTFLFFLTLLFTTGIAFAQTTGTLKGTVKTSDGKPAEFVSILVKETNQGTSVNQTGHYTIKNIKPGTYTVIASFIGLNTESKQVTIVSGKTEVLDLTLTENEKQLDEVYVKLYKANKFLKKETNDIAKLPLKNLENPQVYSVVTSGLMQEQSITNFNDAYKNIPGAGVPLVYNNGRSSLLSRGFTTENLVRNGISGFDYNSVDPANIEKIEAIKGPSGTLFSSTLTSFGGLFNRVTKKPFDTFKGEVSYSAGGFDLNRLTADINTPLNADKTALFRVNTAIHSEHSFQDQGFTRSIFFAPSFSYKMNDRLDIQLDAEISDYDATSAYRFAPFVGATSKVHSITDLGIPYKLSFINNSLDYNSQQFDLFGVINYKLSDHWKSQTAFARTFSTTKGYVTQLTGVTDTTLKQSLQKEDFPYYGTDVQENVIGDIKVVGLRNRVVIGIDVYNQKSNRDYATATMPAINFQHPGVAYNTYNVDKVNAMLATATYTYYQTNQTIYAAYASDVINFTDQLSAMASLRLDRIDNKGTYTPSANTTIGNFGQTALSPKFGLVYQVIKDQISLFGNYMNGFSNVAGTDINGTTFKPQYANQWESGVKLDIWDHKISSTISYYDISVTNTIRPNPANAAFNIQDGTQLSKGVEAELIANPITGLNIIAGYAYNNSVYTAGDPTIVGLRPAVSGPDKMANLWMSYQFMDGKAKGLGFGIGGNHGSRSYQTNTTTAVFTIPAYTLIDAAAFYDQPKYRFSLKADNLTNQQYWSFRLAPQNPARVTASMSIKF